MCGVIDEANRFSSQMKSNHQHIARETYLIFIEIVWQPSYKDLMRRVWHDGRDDAQDWLVDGIRVCHAGHWLIIMRTTDLQTLAFEINS